MLYSMEFPQTLLLLDNTFSCEVNTDRCSLVGGEFRTELFRSTNILTLWRFRFFVILFSSQCVEQTVGGSGVVVELLESVWDLLIHLLLLDKQIDDDDD